MRKEGNHQMSGSTFSITLRKEFSGIARSFQESQGNSSIH